MSFVTWLALGIGLAIVAPLVAHLLRRRPPEEQTFAATALVPPRAAVAQRRTAIEDRALFAVRALAVILLAMLGATPLLRCSRLSFTRQSGASVALAIVVDDSLSMRAQVSGSDQATRLVRAREAAHELLRGMQAGDAVAIVLAGKPPRVALAATTNVDAARGALEQVVESDRGTDLDGAVKLAGELLSDLEHVDKRVVVLSDLARAGGADRALDAPVGGKLWIPLGELRGAREDCAVVRADRLLAKVTVRVACSPSGGADAGTSRAERRIELRAGNEVVNSSRVWLDGDAADVSITLPEEAASKHATTRLWAVLTGSDAIASDDEAPLVDVASELSVGVVSDEPLARVATGGPPPVEQAFAALDLGVRLKPLAAVPDRVDELAPLGLLIVDDASGFTPSQRRELAEWVEKGGVLLVTLGPHAAAAPIGMGFSPMLPGVIRWQRDAPAGIDRATDRLFGEAAAGLDDLKAKGRAKLDLETAGDVHSLVSWKDGAPLVLEHKMGRGVAYSLTLPFTTVESDLVLRPGFLALLSRLAQAARSLGGVARTVVGTAWPLDGFREVTVAFAGKDDRLQPLPIEEPPSGGRRAVTELAGLYRLELDGTVAFRVASIDEAEVDLRPRPVTDELTSAELGGVEAAVDVSGYVAVALLALLLAEIGLRLWARRRHTMESFAFLRGPGPE